MQLSPSAVSDGVSAVELSSLNAIPCGGRAIVHSVQCPEKNLRNKLLVMGLTEGVVVEVTGVAPLGDPITIHLLGFNLSLRRSEAAHIRVIPVPSF